MRYEFLAEFNRHDPAQPRDFASCSLDNDRDGEVEQVIVFKNTNFKLVRYDANYVITDEDIDFVSVVN